MLPKVRQLWRKYCNSTKSLSSLQTVSLLSCDQPSQEGPKEIDDYDQIVNELIEKVGQPTSQDDYEEYCSEPPSNIKISPLQWWSQESQTKRWPQLSLFAREVLSIPAMSDEPERVFSGGRRTVSWDRMQMGTSTIEKLECMKSWHRSGILENS